MTARTKSKVTPKYKTKYHVKNWPAYEASLRKRCDITFWFDEDAVDEWNARPSGCPGGQRTYSDMAIVTTLTLRLVFRLALRQTEGFVASLIRLMGLDLKTPDHTTLSRRHGNVEVPVLSRNHDGPIHLVVDSTGLKMCGDGEWHVHKHRTSNKRRSWRKLHLGVDEDGFIVASDLTKCSEDDASVGVTMIEDIEAVIERFTADGAYDTRAIYDALGATGVPDLRIVVPPRRTASSSPTATGTWAQRNAAIERIDLIGRRRWRKESGAHQQAHAENAMFRYKRIIGDGLKGKKFRTQKTEVKIAVNVINRMTILGMPKSVAVVV